MHRRRFLQLLASCGVAIVCPVPAAAPAPPRVLVLIELQGGNDGLNTLVPYADPAYHRLRPHLAIGRERVLQLDHRLGLHPALEPLMPAWQAGELALVQGVGYPGPDRSHFRAIDIWETGSGSDRLLHDGWLTRALAQLPPGQRPALEGVVLGRGGAGPLAGSRRTLIGRDLDALLRAPPAAVHGGRPRTAALRHLLQVRRTRISGSALLRKAVAGRALPAGFPLDRFGHDLAQAARLIRAGTPIACMLLSLGSFDTHRNQAGTHHRLLGSLAAALAALRASLIDSGDWRRTLVMSYSEFGRRVAENGSGGTDHGTAAPHLVLGGAVRGGLYGESPGLTGLDHGDLRHTVDYRRLYATVERHWLGIGGEFAGRGFRPLPLL